MPSINIIQSFKIDTLKQLQYIIHYNFDKSKASLQIRKDITLRPKTSYLSKGLKPAKSHTYATDYCQND